MNTKIADLCQLISHGVYVIGVSDGEHQNAFTAAWVMQVSFNPVLLAFSISPNHYSYQLLQKGNICSVNVLSKQQMAEAAHFGRSDLADKMAGFEWQQTQTGAPVLAQSLAFFDCEVSHYADAGDHTIAVCKVLDAESLHQGLPMLYKDTGDMDGSDKLFNQESE